MVAELIAKPCVYRENSDAGVRCEISEISVGESMNSVNPDSHKSRYSEITDLRSLDRPSLIETSNLDTHLASSSSFASSSVSDPKGLPFGVEPLLLKVTLLLDSLPALVNFEALP
jgi:hypothetical protein